MGLKVSFFLFQITDLLTAMNLGQYVDTFKKEWIDGITLLELDDSVLQNDLKIAVMLHRKQILKIISGKLSARSIMQGLD